MLSLSTDYLLLRGLSIIVYTERGIKTLGWPAYSAFSAGYASQDLAVTHRLIRSTVQH